MYPPLPGSGPVPGNGDRRATLKSEPVKRLAFAVEVLLRAGIEYVVCLQDNVDLVTGLEARQLPAAGFGQAPGTVFLRIQRFERSPCGIGAIGGATGAGRQGCFR